MFGNKRPFVVGAVCAGILAVGSFIASEPVGQTVTIAEAQNVWGAACGAPKNVNVQQCLIECTLLCLSSGCSSCGCPSKPDVGGPTPQLTSSVPCGAAGCGARTSFDGVGCGT